jgi:hypothetical protein
MPNWVPIIDPDGLNILFNRLARLRQQLEEIAKERDKILVQQRSRRGKDEENQENDINEGKAYPRASGATISGGEKHRLVIEHKANISSPEGPTCPIFRTP